MDVRVRGSVSPTPFLSARDLLSTEYDLSFPVEVNVRTNPDERTWVAHYDDRHVLNISAQAATSAMARELALHEFAHMVRYEESHPSHLQNTEEALYLGLAGRTVERRKVAHCYQIANHMKDVYADDITLTVGPTDKLVSFFESELAAALADRPSRPPSGAMTAVRNGGFTRESPSADPDITAVNAAFALGLARRHDLLDDDHQIHDLAHAAARDAPDVNLERFTGHFASLEPDIDESSYRKALVDITREYAIGSEQAAD